MSLYHDRRSEHLSFGFWILPYCLMQCAPIEEPKMISFFTLDSIVGAPSSHFQPSQVTQPVNWFGALTQNSYSMSFSQKKRKQNPSRFFLKPEIHQYNTSILKMLAEFFLNNMSNFTKNVNIHWRIHQHFAIF